MEKPTNPEYVRVDGRKLALPTKPFDIEKVQDTFSLLGEMKCSGDGYSRIYYEYLINNKDLDGFIRSLKKMPHWDAIREKIFSRCSIEDFAAFMTNGIKEFHPVPFTDNYLFQTVLSDNLVCKLFLEAVLKRPIKSVEPQVEHFVQLARGMHGIRLDVCVELEDKTLIDVEMQVASQKFLYKRIAAYRANLIVEQLQKTIVDDRFYYEEIHPVVVIFICDFSPICVGNRTITYFDVVTRHDGKMVEPNLGSDVIINLHGTDNDGLDTILNEFRNAINSNGYAPFSKNNELVSLFNQKARTIQKNEEWRLEKMSMSFWEADIRSQSEAEGEDKLSKLITLLLEKNNIEAIQKVTKDASFRKQLYKEYGIV